MLATLNAPIIVHTLSRIAALRAVTVSPTIRRRCDLALNPSVGLKVRGNAMQSLLRYMDTTTTTTEN